MVVERAVQLLTYEHYFSKVLVPFNHSIARHGTQKKKKKKKKKKRLGLQQIMLTESSDRRTESG